MKKNIGLIFSAIACVIISYILFYSSDIFKQNIFLLILEHYGNFLGNHFFDIIIGILLTIIVFHWKMCNKTNGTIDELKNELMEKFHDELRTNNETMKKEIGLYIEQEINNMKQDFDCKIKQLNTIT